VSVLLESCLDSVELATAAEQAGAGRIELCEHLEVGGTTPSEDLIRAVVGAIKIPVFAIIRPRGGNFFYTASELDRMKRDAEMAKRAGAAGIVVGVLRSDDTVDEQRTREVVQAADGLPATFHLAFERVPKQHDALDALMRIGMTRVLTKGGHRTALEGADALRSLVDHARDRIVVMAGGNVRETNVAEIVQKSGVREVHSRGLNVAEIVKEANAA
jgi:copper homeostasis protein